MSMENNIESFIDIFSQILSEIKFKKNDNHLFEKLNGDNNNNNNNKKKGQKFDEGKCLLKENPLPNIDLLMKDIIIVKENIIYELNAIKIYDEIRNEYILYLLKNLEYLYNSLSQKINQDQENSLFLNEINRSIKHLNNESGSNFHFNIMNNLSKNSYQMNKAKNNQELLLSLINQNNINQSDNIPSLINKNINRDFLT